MSASRTGDRRLPWACDTCHRFYELELVARLCHQEGQRVPKRDGHTHHGNCCTWGSVILPKLSPSNRAKVDRWMAENGPGRVTTRAIARKVNGLKLTQYPIGDQQVQLHRAGLCLCCQHEAALHGWDAREGDPDLDPQ